MDIRATPTRLDPWTFARLGGGSWVGCLYVAILGVLRRVSMRIDLTGGLRFLETNIAEAVRRSRSEEEI